jgi:hypothetical protein
MALVSAVFPHEGVNEKRANHGEHGENENFSKGFLRVSP